VARAWDLLRALEWSTVLAILAAVGGLGVLSEALLARWSRAAKNVLHVLVVLPLAVLAGPPVLGPALEPLVDRARPRTTYERIEDRHLSRLAAMPEWQTRARGLSRPAARELAFSLARRGRGRLDAPSLMQLGELFRRLLAMADEPVCAQMARGRERPLDLQRLVQGADDSTIDAFFDVAARAVAAELRETPSTAATRAMRAAALRALLERLVPLDRPRMLAAQTALLQGRAADGEACWAARALFDVVGQVREPHREVLMREALDPRGS